MALLAPARANASTGHAITALGMAGAVEIWEKTMIQKTEGVCGGSARIRNTRIPVWLLVAYRLVDTSDSQLLKSYPDLTQTDLNEAWKYYEDHQVEIDQDLLENESD
jgi:uncharacterized protein (DUF433 family)